MRSTARPNNQCRPPTTWRPRRLSASLTITANHDESAGPTCARLGVSEEIIDQLKAKDVELVATQQRLAAAQKQVELVTAARPMNRATATWLDSAIGDSSATDWDRLSQDQQYAAFWAKQAAVTNLKTYDGRGLPTKVTCIVLPDTPEETGRK